MSKLQTKQSHYSDVGLLYKLYKPGFIFEKLRTLNTVGKSEKCDKMVGQ